MKNNSRFTKIAVASGLIVASGAAVLGITGFASAELAPKSNPAVVAQATNETGTGAAATDTTVAGGVTGQAVDGATVPSDLQDGDHGGHGAPRFVTDALAKVLKLSTTELNTQLQSGKTLADIAKAQSVDIADVKAQILKDFTDKEQAEVATGEHTQAEVDAKIADFKTRLDDIVNGVRPAGGPGMGGKGGHGGHGHGDMDGDGPMGTGGTAGGPLQNSSTQNASA